MTIINSVQNISVTIAAGSTTGTAVINSVNTSAACCSFAGQEGAASATSVAKEFAGLTLTNNTTVTATRGVSDATNALVVNCCVLEFNALAIKSLQQGTVVMTDQLSNTATITSVTTTNAVCVFGGYTSSDATTDLEVLGRVQLTNSTTVTANCGGTAAGEVDTAYFTIVEFNSGYLNSSVQSGTITLPTGTASNTAVLSSVTTSQAMVFWGGFTYTGTLNSFAALPYLSLTNSTTLTASAPNTGSRSSTMPVNWSVVEFKAADINSLNRGTIVIPDSASTNTASIAAVNTSYTAANWCGVTTNNTTASFLNEYATIGLTNSTTLTATRNGSSATTTCTVSYEAIEFVPPSPFRPWMFE